MFPCDSQRVPIIPQVVPQDISIARQFLLHMVCPKFNSHRHKLKRCAIRESKYAYILQLGVRRGASIGECPIFQKPFMMGPINPFTLQTLLSVVSRSKEIFIKSGNEMLKISI
jgi:hypothetical protein